jgi:hypothetical protein
MTRTVVFFSLLVTVLFLTNADCNDQVPSPNSNYFGTNANGEGMKDESGSRFWQAIWGIKARDALLLGMWSLHLDGTGEYFGNGSNNDQNYLLGIQYWGLSAGSFINSKDDRAWFFGPAREVYSYRFTDDIRFDCGYKFGLLYGYGDELINVGGMSVFAIANFGISWKRLGFDLGVLPVGILTGNFRLDIDF